MLAMAHGAARPRIKYGACPLLMVSLSNQLSGQILPELGNLVSLKILDLADALHSLPARETAPVLLSRRPVPAAVFALDGPDITL